MTTTDSTASSIEQTLAGLVTETARVDRDPATLTADTSLVDELGIDSILLVELIVNIETAFDIDLEDEDVEISKIIRYGSLVEVVTNRTVAARSAGPSRLTS